MERRERHKRGIESLNKKYIHFPFSALFKYKLIFLVSWAKFSLDEMFLWGLSGTAALIPNCFLLFILGRRY